MPNHSKRMFTLVMPYETGSGKLARKADKVSKDNPGFKCFVGYKQFVSPTINRFQVRIKPITAAATPSQDAQKNRFKSAVANTKAIMTDPDQLLPYRNAWRDNPSGYKTLRGFVFAEVIANIE